MVDEDGVREIRRGSRRIERLRVFVHCNRSRASTSAARRIGRRSWLARGARPEQNVHGRRIALSTTHGNGRTKLGVCEERSDVLQKAVRSSPTTNDKLIRNIKGVFVVWGLMACDLQGVTGGLTRGGGDSWCRRRTGPLGVKFLLPGSGRSGAGVVEHGPGARLRAGTRRPLLSAEEMALSWASTVVPMAAESVSRGSAG